MNKVELAVIGELLLRGPQTEGELRCASRMESIDDLDTLCADLQLMKERGLIVYLTEENRRGTILTHGLYLPGELYRLRGQVKLDPRLDNVVSALCSWKAWPRRRHADRRWRPCVPNCRKCAVSP